MSFFGNYFVDMLCQARVFLDQFRLYVSLNRRLDRGGRLDIVPSICVKFLEHSDPDVDARVPRLNIAKQSFWQRSS